MHICKGNLYFLFLLAILLSNCQSRDVQSVSDTSEGLPDLIDYNFHVRPILSDKCFACHGPDVENQKAGLRLDQEADAKKRLQNGKGYAIVSGKPNKSEAYLRMITEDESSIMPPPESHLKLSTLEKAIIARWIEQGAEYKPHWAFVPPTKETLPKVKHAQWIQQPIDNFILKQLEERGLAPSPPASKETLIRRITFDLTGLPPTLEEIDAFLNDDTPDAYPKLVARLLASKAYGERMAADWLDVARYADSDGYLDDKHREFSPWRDWVIEAFNKNLPYNEFITSQLAGDLMPNADKESTLATAFNRLHKKNSEAGIVFEEYRVEYVADRTNTLGTAILGLSVECARCHDHKYDPISQKDYYQLFGFFNSTFEIGTPVYGPEQVPGPSLLLSTELEDEEIEAIKAMINELEEQKQSIRDDHKGFKQWINALNYHDDFVKNINRAMTAYYPFDALKSTDNKGVYHSPNQVAPSLAAKLIEPIHNKGYKGKALFVSDYNSIRLGEKIGWYDRTDDFSFQLHIRPDTIYKEAGVLWHSEELRLGLKGYSLHLQDNKLRFIIAKTWPQNAIEVQTELSVPAKEWSQVAVTYDGSSKAAGISIFINGQKQKLEIIFDNLYKSILFVPDIHTYGFSGITLGARDKFIPFKNGGLDEVMVFNRALSDLEVLQLYDPNQVEEIIANKNGTQKLLSEHYFSTVDQASQEKKKELKKWREAENRILTDIKEIMVMGDLPEPRPTYVLSRGIYNAPSEQVEPNTPGAIMPFDERYPKNRYGLSQWLFDEKNPLTARVYVNRIWQMYFGQGLVRTSDDLGAQGSLPSHPALLDWLAASFIESGWDIKALHQLIATSATYQQSSKLSPNVLEKDPENILLSRGPRYRLPAEMIRDNALAVSGLLVKKQGGESVYPYQPEGLWNEITKKHWAYKYLQEPGEGLYRRSIYTIWKRQSPPPFMQIFDVNDRGSCSVKRNVSSTPLQALNLLNDPQFVEAARVLAERLMKTEPEDAKRLEKLFRLLTGRKPDSQEQQMLEDFYQEELDHFLKSPKKAIAFMANGEHPYDSKLNVAEIAALGVVGSAIMNTSEAYTKK